MLKILPDKFRLILGLGWLVLGLLLPACGAEATSTPPPTVAVTAEPSATSSLEETGRQFITLGTRVTASLDWDGADDYEFAAQADLPILAFIEPESPVDFVGELFHAESGTILIRENSSFGTEVIALTPNFDGNYFIRVRSADGSPGTYTLHLVNNQITLFQEFAALEGETPHTYTIPGRSGIPLHIVVENDQSLDAVVDVIDAGGNVLDSVNQFLEFEAFTFTPTVDGDYTIRVSGSAGSRGSYRITVGTGQP